MGIKNFFKSTSDKKSNLKSKVKRGAMNIVTGATVSNWEASYRKGAILASKLSKFGFAKLGDSMIDYIENKKLYDEAKEDSKKKELETSLISRSKSIYEYICSNCNGIKKVINQTRSDKNSTNSLSEGIFKSITGACDEFANAAKTPPENGMITKETIEVFIKKLENVKKSFSKAIKEGKKFFVISEVGSRSSIRSSKLIERFKIIIEGIDNALKVLGKSKDNKCIKSKYNIMKAAKRKLRNL